MMRRLWLLALGACLVGQAAPSFAQAQAQARAQCRLERPFQTGAAFDRSRVLGPPGAECLVTWRYHRRNGEPVRPRATVVGHPGSGALALEPVFDGTTSYRVRYRPSSSAPVRDSFTINFCDEDNARCFRREFFVELSGEARQALSHQCRTRPFEPRLNGVVTIDLTGPRGSPCYVHFQQLHQRVMITIPSHPANGLAQVERGSLVYRPYAGTTSDALRVRLCLAADRSQCATIDARIRYQ